MPRLSHGTRSVASASKNIGVLPSIGPRLGRRAEAGSAPVGPRRHAPPSGPTEDAPPPTRCVWGAVRACMARNRGQRAAEAFADISKYFGHAPCSRLVARPTELGVPHPAPPLVDPQLPLGTARRRRRGLRARCLCALAGRSLRAALSLPPSSGRSPTRRSWRCAGRCLWWSSRSSSTVSASGPRRMAAGLPRSPSDQATRVSLPLPSRAVGCPWTLASVRLPLRHPSCST